MADSKDSASLAQPILSGIDVVLETFIRQLKNLEGDESCGTILADLQAVSKKVKERLA